MTDTISEVQMTSSIEAETRGYPTFDFSEYKREDTSIAEETSYYNTSMVADIEQRARSNVSPLNKEISSTVAVSLVVLLLNVSAAYIRVLHAGQVWNYQNECGGSKQEKSETNNTSAVEERQMLCGSTKEYVKQARQV
uniref:uncharacterized protein LOC120325809 n=1 Tax=Styela clava TaxID=7725 RepID=UPI00193A9358|nr:uncharacterized protein LOC120325809 [Styela clava]